MKIVNEECDYIVKNIEAVQALQESFERAQKRVPTWIQRKLYDILTRKITEIESFEKMQWDIESDDKEISITPGNKNYFDPEIDMGAYFLIYAFDWDEISADDREDGMWACLVYNLPETTKEKNKYGALNWKKDQFDAVTSTLAELDEKYVPLRDEEDEVLIAFYLYDTLNIKALASDPERTLMDVSEKILTFMESTCNVMKLVH